VLEPPLEVAAAVRMAMACRPAWGASDAGRCGEVLAT
jgi:hypothetical protein